MTSLAKRAAASAVAQFISASGVSPMSVPSDFTIDRIGDRAAGRVGFGRVVVEFDAKFGQALAAGDLLGRQLAGRVGAVGGCGGRGASVLAGRRRGRPWPAPSHPAFRLPSADSVQEWGRFPAASRPVEMLREQAASVVPGQGQPAFAKAACPATSRVGLVQEWARHRHFPAALRWHRRERCLREPLAWAAASADPARGLRASSPARRLADCPRAPE